MASWYKYVGVIISSLILVFGGTLTAKFAFAGNIWLSFVGMMLSAIGYKGAQMAFHTSHYSSCRTALVPRSKELLLSNIVVAVGMFFVAFGLVTGAQATVHPTPVSMAITGVCIVSGYVIAHREVHEVAL